MENSPTFLSHLNQVYQITKLDINIWLYFNGQIIRNDQLMTDIIYRS